MMAVKHANLKWILDLKKGVSANLELPNRVKAVGISFPVSKNIKRIIPSLGNIFQPPSVVSLLRLRHVSQALLDVLTCCHELLLCKLI